MRTIALLLLLAATLTYLLPSYRSIVPANIPLADSQTANVAATLVILGIIALAQLVVVLDGTIVNITLPSAQHALAFTNDNRQWIVTGYALAFGSLLLVGGRLSDLVGRRPMFITGLVGFAAASAVGGAAQGFGTLVSARVAQGVFGALLQTEILSIGMMSGGVFTMTLGDLIVLIGLLFLFLETVKSARASKASIMDHLLSTLVFIAFLVEFLLVKGAAHSVFFILMVITLVDVLAGFVVAMRAATRDINLN